MNGEEEEELEPPHSSVEIIEGAENEPLVTARDFLVVSGESVDHKYRPGSLTLANGETLPVIPVAEVEGRLVVAVPESSWHRTPGKRLLPAKSFTKPALCAVAGCLALEREREEDIVIQLKVWIGFLSKKLEHQLDFVNEPSGRQFGMVGDDPVLPYGPALVEVVNEHFAFLGASAKDTECKSSDRSVGTDDACSKAWTRFCSHRAQDPVLAANPKQPPGLPP